MDASRRHAPADAAPRRIRISSLSVVMPCSTPAAMPSIEELHALVRAVADAGDRQAFAVLFKHYAPRVKGFLMRGGTPDGLAEELAQETMVVLWRRAAAFDPARAQLSTWIYTIARNLRIDAHRRHRDTFGAEPPELAAADVEPSASPCTPDELAQDRQRVRGVHAAFELLPAEQALVLQRAFFEDQPHVRIAQELGIPLGTVKSRIRIAMDRLRRLLEPYAP
ncbi:MAG: sigma-70 family RNA polymerase sigma factor [Proteobacteria bacterium]|nr:sigma-70 family RNA polymerase sigma factor [Pseudomonadota bacterium]